jgi:glycosyltransferase involved in cell wall biosynthesis
MNVLPNCSPLAPREESEARAEESELLAEREARFPLAEREGYRKGNPLAEREGYVALTVIVPVFNEERTVVELLTRLANAPYAEKQVIIVDDGSTDRTAELLRDWNARTGWLVLTLPKNCGKGSAVRLGLEHAIGEVTIVQDADLEYDPADLPAVVEPVLHGEAEAVYGSRSLSGEPGRPWHSPYRVAVFILNWLSWVLYGHRLTDQSTCYKALPTSIWRRLDLRSERFELCTEITAKLGRLRVPIREVAIRYRPRTRAEGKKIGWRDAVSAAATLIRWRLKRVENGMQCNAMQRNGRKTGGWRPLPPFICRPTVVSR